MLADGQNLAPGRRTMITIAVTLASILTALDTTIANVALPNIRGSLSATLEQMGWVLTSYFVATAIMTPLAGWLAGRVGRRKVLLISIAGFTLTSALCGIATSLSELVLFRACRALAARPWRRCHRRCRSTSIRRNITVGRRPSGRWA
jgi:DHA2 family multidrug resistance protein